jgi:hypothetical protein
VIQLPYPVNDLSRLPDAAGYRRLDLFQERWVEPACEALGWTFVAWKSEDGSFFLYLYGSGDPNEMLEKLTPFDEALTFYNDRDDEWAEYAALRELVDQAEAADQDDTNGEGHPHVHAADDDHDHDHDDHDHNHHDHVHNNHDHRGSIGEVVKRTGRTTRAATVGERPSNARRKQPPTRPAKTAAKVTKRAAPAGKPAKKAAASAKPAAKAAAKRAASAKPAAKAVTKRPTSAKPVTKRPAPAKPAAKTPARKAAKPKSKPARR